MLRLAESEICQLRHKLAKIEEAQDIALLICHFVEQQCRALYSCTPQLALVKDSGIKGAPSSPSPDEDCTTGNVNSFAERSNTRDVQHPDARTHSVCNIVQIMVRKYREKKAPHTNALPARSMHVWDHMFTTVLLFSIFRELPTVGWARAIADLAQSDLMETEPYDGSCGPVQALYEKCVNMPAMVYSMANGSHARGANVTDLADTGHKYGQRKLVSENKTAESLWEAFLTRNPSSAGDRGVYSGRRSHTGLKQDRPLSIESKDDRDKYQPTPLLLGDTSLGGWGLMHFLASCLVESKVFALSGGQSTTSSSSSSSSPPAVVLNRITDVLLSSGVRLMEKDFSGRTPLHVACSILHVDMVLSLLSHGASVESVDDSGCTPLDTFLRALGTCNWRYHTTHSQSGNANSKHNASLSEIRSGYEDKIENSHNRSSGSSFKTCTSEQVLQCVVALTGNIVSRLWALKTTASLSDRASAYMSNPLVLALKYGDGVVIKGVVSASRLCSAAQWDRTVVRHCLLQAIRSGRVWLVEYLWNEYFNVLESLEMPGAISDGTGGRTVDLATFSVALENWIVFSQTCMSAAIISNSYRFQKAIAASAATSAVTSSVSFTLSFLLRKFLQMRSSMEKISVIAKQHRNQPDGLVESSTDIFDLCFCKTWSPFLHAAILRVSKTFQGPHADVVEGRPPSDFRVAEHRSILQLMLSSDIVSVQHVLGTLAERSCQSPTDDFAILGRLWSPIVEQEPFKSYCRLLSPLSLAFYLHDDVAIECLLSFIIVAQKNTPLTATQCCAMKISPLVACAISGNCSGLRKLQSHMGKSAFKSALNSPDASGTLALPMLLHIVGLRRCNAAACAGLIPTFKSRRALKIGAGGMDRLQVSGDLSPLVALPLDNDKILKTISFLLESGGGEITAANLCETAQPRAEPRLCVWEVRRRQLFDRLSQINHRIGQILHPESAVAVTSSAEKMGPGDVAAYLDNLLKDQPLPRKRELFQCINQSVETWDRVQQLIGATSSIAENEDASSEFLCHMRTLHTAYTPSAGKGQQRQSPEFEKIIQCVAIVLEKEVYGGVGAGSATKYAVGNAAAAWQRLKILIGGPVGASRSNMLRRLVQMRQHLASFRDPFISEIVSGRRNAKVGITQEVNARRVVGRDTWLLLHRHLPKPATHFVVEDPVTAPSSSASSAPAFLSFSASSRTQSARNQDQPPLQSDSADLKAPTSLPPSAAIALDILHNWLLAVYHDGTILYSGAYDLNINSSKVDIEKGNSSLALVLELISLVEGRTRATTALHRFPVAEQQNRTSPGGTDSSLSILFGSLLLSSDGLAGGVNNANTAAFLPLSDVAYNPASSALIARTCMNLVRDAACEGLGGCACGAGRGCSAAHSGGYSECLQLAEDVALLLLDTLNGNGIQVKDGVSSMGPAAMRSQILFYLVSCGMWSAASKVLCKCEEGLLFLVDAPSASNSAEVKDEGKSYLSGYPTVLSGAFAMEEIDFVAQAGLSSKVAMMMHSDRSGDKDVAAKRRDWHWSWAQCDLLTLTEVHPLHFAVRANCPEASSFIEKFFSAFPDTSLDAMSLAHLMKSFPLRKPSKNSSKTREGGSGSPLELIFAHVNILEVPVTTDLQAVYLDHGVTTLGLALHGVRRSRLQGFVDKKAVKSLGEFPEFEMDRFKCMEGALFEAVSCGVLINAARHSRQDVTSLVPSFGSQIGKKARMQTVIPQTGGQLQGLCVLTENQTEESVSTLLPLSVSASGKIAGPGAKAGGGAMIAAAISQNKPRIALMDGTSIPYKHFYASIYPLLRAVPMPIVACGVNQSGYTLLHSLGSGEGLTAAKRLLELGSWRVLAADANGYTPLHMALRGGDLALAKQMLKTVVSSQTVEPVHRVVARHSALPLRELAPNALLQQATSRRKAAEVEYFGVNASEKPPFHTAAESGDLNVQSLASAGLHLSRVSTLEELLIYTMHRAAVSWQHIASQDFSRLLQLSNRRRGAPKHSAAAPPAEAVDTSVDASSESKEEVDQNNKGEASAIKAAASGSGNPPDAGPEIVLDSVMRARALLDILRVPVAQLPLSRAESKRVKISNAKSSAASSTTSASTDTAAKSQNGLANMWDMMSPSLLKERLTVEDSSKVKAQLLGWYMRRTVSSGDGAIGSKSAHAKTPSSSFPAAAKHGAYRPKGGALAARRLGAVEHGRRLQMSDEMYLWRALQVSCVCLGESAGGELMNSYGEYGDWDLEDAMRTSESSKRANAYDRFSDRRSFAGFGESTTLDAASYVLGKKAQRYPASGNSHLLVRQLVIDTRPSELGNAYFGDYTISGSAASYIQNQALQTEHLLSFMRHWRADADGLQQALRLAYKILDWARLLYLSRQLVAMTAMPPSNAAFALQGNLASQRKYDAASWVHPLELRFQKWSLCVQYERQARVVAHPPPPPTPAAAAAAAASVPPDGRDFTSRLRICDLLDPADLARFFRTGRGISERYDALRDLAVRALVCCCLLLGREKMAVFVGFISRKGAPPDVSIAPSASTASLLEEKIEDAEIGEGKISGLSALLRVLQNISVTSILARQDGASFREFAECARELCHIARTLQGFDLDVHSAQILGGDVTVTAPIKPRRDLEQSARKSSQSGNGIIDGYLSENMVTPHRVYRYGRLDGNGEHTATDTDAIKRGVFGVTITDSESDALLAASGKDAVAELRSNYTTANALIWLVQAVAGIAGSGAKDSGTLGALARDRTITPQAIYATLIQDWKLLTLLKNPLCMISFTSNALSTFNEMQKKFFAPFEQKQHLHSGASSSSEGLFSDSDVSIQKGCSLFRKMGWKIIRYKAMSEVMSSSLEMQSHRLQCCKGLLHLGCSPTAEDGHGRVPLSVAAVFGQPRILELMLRYCTDEQIENDLRDGLRRGLCWHVLMASPAFEIVPRDSPLASLDDAGGGKDGAADCKDGSAEAYERCLLLLHSRGFTFDRPQETPSKRQSTQQEGSSCLQLALLKRFKRAVLAICEELQANRESMTAGSLASSAHDLDITEAADATSSFGPLHLAVVWPHVPLECLSRVVDAQSQSPSMHRSYPLLALPMSHIILPRSLERDAALHSQFMARICAVHAFNSSQAESKALSGELLRDTCLELIKVFESNYSPNARKGCGVTSDCALWRAAMNNIACLLHRAQNSFAIFGPSDASLPAGAASAASETLATALPDKRPLVRGRATPGKARLTQDEALQRAPGDTSIQYPKWCLFDLVVCTRRTDVTNMIFRRFQLYGSSHPFALYPSPLRLSLLASFYDAPHVMLAVALYSGQSDHEDKSQKSSGVSADSPRSTGTLGMRQELARKGELAVTMPRRGYGAVTPLELAYLRSNASATTYLVQTVGVHVTWSHVLEVLLYSLLPQEQCVALLREHLKQSLTTAQQNWQRDSAPVKTSEYPDEGDLRTLLNTPLLAFTFNFASDIRSGNNAVLFPGETLLHLCARRGYNLVIDILLEHGANSRLKDARGNMPLHLAVCFGQQAATRSLAKEHPRLRRSVQWLGVKVRTWLLRKSRSQFKALVVSGQGSETVKVKDVYARGNDRTAAFNASQDSGLLLTPRSYTPGSATAITASISSVSNSSTSTSSLSLSAGVLEMSNAAEAALQRAAAAHKRLAQAMKAVTVNATAATPLEHNEEKQTAAYP